MLSGSPHENADAAIEGFRRLVGGDLSSTLFAIGDDLDLCGIDALCLEQLEQRIRPACGERFVVLPGADRIRETDQADVLDVLFLDPGGLPCPIGVLSPMHRVLSLQAGVVLLPVWLLGF